MRWIVAVAGCLLWAVGPCPCYGGASVERFLVEGRVHVTLVTLDDGARGGIIWQDTTMPRSGEEPSRISLIIATIYTVPRTTTGEADTFQDTGPSVTTWGLECFPAHCRLEGKRARHLHPG